MSGEKRPDAMVMMLRWWVPDGGGERMRLSTASTFSTKADHARKRGHTNVVARYPTVRMTMLVAPLRHADEERQSASRCPE